MSDKNKDTWYDIWEDEDKPSNTLDAQALEIARLQGIVDANSQQKIEKVYLVKGESIFVCHKGELKMVKKLNDQNKPVRDFTITGARMVVYGRDGLRKVDQ